MGRTTLLQGVDHDLGIERSVVDGDHRHLLAHVRFLTLVGTVAERPWRCQSAHATTRNATRAHVWEWLTGPVPSRVPANCRLTTVIAGSSAFPRARDGNVSIGSVTYDARR